MSTQLRLSGLQFRAGSHPDTGPLNVRPGSVLLLVGPNNSGKSLTLREIEEWIISGRPGRIVESVDIEYPDDPAMAENLARRFQVPSPKAEGEDRGYFWMSQFMLHSARATPQPIQVSIQSLHQAAQRQHYTTLRKWLTTFYTVRLDGRTRFWLVEPKPTGDLRKPPENHLWALFMDDDARAQMRQLTAETFGLHFVIDPTAMQYFAIRLSPQAPSSRAEEQGLDESARVFHARATPITDFGDGIQAFVGLASAILSLPHKIVLIDEPEAYLHPPLARRLGSWLASTVRQRGASLIVSTHSADVTMGSLESANDTVVVRLTYESATATTRVLSATELQAVMRDPLLRSTGVLRALFHRGAVVVEADSDRAFYDEINRRLLADQRGVSDVLFMNAQNRDTVHRVVRPLRRLGIPAAAIVDLDVLEQGGGKWEALLSACQIPQGSWASLDTERAYLAAKFASGVVGKARPITRSGLQALDAADRTRAEVLLQELARFGLFLVPGGELESWLPAYGNTKHGTEWLIDLFGKIGQSDTDPNYAKPGNDDVWAFLDRIARWINDTYHLGTQ